jgi:phosphatidyl-myo-inositol dimannoside synthase
MRRRILSIGHSYVVALNRRLADEMAKVGSEDWDVTAVAPEFMPGDLRPIAVESLADEACKLVTLPMKFSSKPHLMYYGGLRRVMNSEPWDIVHIWQEPFTVAGWQCAMLAPKSAQVVVSTFQNIPKNYPPPFCWMERAALRRSNGWIAFGESIRQTLQDRIVYRECPHRVIPVGVDTEKFSPDRESGRQVSVQLGWHTQDIPAVGYLGRFIPEKGLDILMQVLDSIDRPWRALFVGGGPMEGALREWAEKHAPRVRIVTGVAHDQVPAYLNAMDMLIAPSQTGKAWREQLGRMLLEAFACGVPVVGSDSGEIPAVIGSAGRVVAEKDFDAWKSTIEELLSSSVVREDLSQRGRAEALNRFAWRVVATSHLQFFETLLNNKTN